jgi:hypothetical protein
MFDLNHFRAHREQESADVIQDEPIERCANNGHIKHATLALAYAKRNAGDKYEDCQNIGENHDGIEKGAVVTCKRRK